MATAHVISDFRHNVLQSVRGLLHKVPVRGRFRLASIVSSALVPREKVVLGHIEQAKPMVFDFRNPHEISMYFDFFAPELTKVLKKLLRPGDVFVDCGANIGYFSCLAATLVGHRGKVYAIDANPFCTERIEESRAAGHYANIEVVPCAVGASAGTIVFNLADDPMYSSVANLDGLSFAKIQSTARVPLRTLDHVLHPCLASQQRIRLVKIDIEGAEVDALAGADAVLGSRLIDYIYVEVHHKQLELQGQKPALVHEVLSSRGYGIDERFGDYAYLYRSPS